MYRKCRGLLAIFAILAMTGTTLAETPFPNRPVHLLVGFVPGGPNDIIARLLAEKLSERWHQPVVVENVPGAASTIAGERVARAAPDGYTLLLSSDALFTINPLLYDKMSYDPNKTLVPISRLVFTPNILTVNDAVPARNVQELVALARAKPGTLTFGSAGVGTSQHLAGELFKFMTHVDIEHVPYRGAAPVVTDLLAGRITMFFGSPGPLLPQINQGKLRALAVTSLKRFALTPDLPTIAESGFPGYDVAVSFGPVAPAGTPAEVIDKIYRDSISAFAQEDMRKRLNAIGMEVVAGTPAEFSATIKSQIPQWTKLVKEIGLKASD